MTSAQRNLVTENLGLAHGAARKYARYVTDDVVSDAHLGLCDAAVSWKPDGGSKFSSWAYTAIRNRIGAGFAKLRQRNLHGRMLFGDEVYDYRYSEERFDEGPDDPVLRSLREAVAYLPSRERFVVCAVAYDGLTYREVGERMGLSHAHIGTIYHSGLGRIRRYLLSREAA